MSVAFDAAERVLDFFFGFDVFVVDGVELGFGDELVAGGDGGVTLGDAGSLAVFVACVEVDADCAPEGEKEEGDWRLVSLFDFIEEGGMTYQALWRRCWREGQSGAPRYVAPMGE